MANREDVIRLVQKALEHEPRINIHRHPIHIASADGTVTLEGEALGRDVGHLAFERTMPQSRTRRPVSAFPSDHVPTFSTCPTQGSSHGT